MEEKDVKMYSKEEVLQESRKYFGGDGLAADVVMKYLLYDSSGNYLEKSPVDMHHRLAGEFARIEKKYPNPMGEEEIFQLLDGFRKVIPQGSPMSGVGNNNQLQSLSNCFVVDSPNDSYGGILLADQEQVQIMKRRGGVGFDISTIRPRGMITSNAAKTTDGIGVFMERFSNSCREVAQGGRRGALMLTISGKHCEIETFIDIKRNLKKVTGANVSIRLDDEFMQAVERDGDYTLQWPVDVPVEEAKITRKVKARQLWDKIIDSAWTMAEPGLLFWDTVRRNTPADCYDKKGYETISTNPCSELVLSAYDSCRLMVVNVLSYVRDTYLPTASFDRQEFEHDVYKAQRLMDDLVDLELEKVDEILAKIERDKAPDHVKRVERELWQKIKNATAGGRRTGLGVTGVGDAVAALGFRYGSDESIAAVEEIYSSLARGAYTSSIDMAVERGPFPVWEQQLEEGHQFLKRINGNLDDNHREKHKTSGRRNIALTTTAPVGSVSLLTQTTSGIEPAFLLSYRRRRKLVDTAKDEKVDFVDDMGDRWQEYEVFHAGFKHWMDVTGKTDPAESPYFKSTSNDVDWLASVKLQAAAQRWVCHSLSKTCNLPSSATRETVSQVYMEAWRQGCKGFTVYRDGCRTGVLVKNDGDKSRKKDTQPAEIAYTHAPKRPKSLPCDIHHVRIRSGDESQSWLVLVGLMKELPYEVFCGLAETIETPKKAKQGRLVRNGKRDGLSTYTLGVPVGEDDEILLKDIVSLFSNPTHASFTRTISLALRHGAPVNYIVEQLQKDKSDMMSFSKVVARVLKSYIPDGTVPATDKACPSCGGGELKYSEGCVSCVSCFWSKCA